MYHQIWQKNMLLATGHNRWHEFFCSGYKQATQWSILFMIMTLPPNLYVNDDVTSTYMPSPIGVVPELQIKRLPNYHVFLRFISILVQSDDRINNLFYYSDVDWLVNTYIHAYVRTYVCMYVYNVYIYTYIYSFTDTRRSLAKLISLVISPNTFRLCQNLKAHEFLSLH